MGTDRPKPKEEWSPRIWLGCDLFAWLRLLWLGRYSFGWRELRLLPIGTVMAAVHTFLRYAQDGLYGARLRSVRIQSPIFILGHWRSGTTLLHELLVLDPRHAFPDTYECFDPNHPLLTARFVRRYFTWLLPPKRMMDNMPVGWDRPQEDEFALAMMGAPSPYLTIAFPNRGPLDAAALDLDDLPARDRDRWKRLFVRFLRTVAARDPRRLVLKSPPHTCRIPTLLELFPDAHFVHIVRDPFAVYSSTVNLWKKLYRAQAMQRPTFAGLEEYVLETFVHFHRRLAATRDLVPAGRFHEVKYEDLTKDPAAELRRLYDRLGLGDFEHVRPHLERYLAETANYERNRWELSDAERDVIRARWGEVIRANGYD
jgi:omega-hydroxy-beta-dihydromenaquinone-9 sulfotransferase